MTIRDIIAKAGGAKTIAEALDGSVKIDAVYKWPTIGIPDRHWPTIISLAGVSAQELFDANVEARSLTETAA